MTLIMMLILKKYTNQLLNLKQIVSETKETKKSIEGINGIPSILEKRPEPLAIKDVPISTQTFGPIATKYLGKILAKK